MFNWGRDDIFILRQLPSGDFSFSYKALLKQIEVFENRGVEYLTGQTVVKGVTSGGQSWFECFNILRFSFTFRLVRVKWLQNLGQKLYQQTNINN